MREARAGALPLRGGGDRRGKKKKISMAEETEIHRITNQLKILPQDLTKLRVRHGRFLPGLSKKG